MINIKKLVNIFRNEGISLHTHTCLACGLTFSTDQDNCVSCSSPDIIRGRGAVVYDQQTTDERIPELLMLSARPKFLIIDTERVDGKVNLYPYIGTNTYRCDCGWHETERYPTLRRKKNKDSVLICVLCGEKAMSFRGIDLIILWKTDFDKQMFWVEWIIAQCKAVKIPVLKIT